MSFSTQSILQQHKSGVYKIIFNWDHKLNQNKIKFHKLIVCNLVDKNNKKIIFSTNITFQSITYNPTIKMKSSIMNSLSQTKNSPNNSTLLIKKFNTKNKIKLLNNPIALMNNLIILMESLILKVRKYKKER